MNRLSIISFMALPLFFGCSDFLEPYPVKDITEEDLTRHPSYVKGLINKAYDLLPTTYLSNEFVYLDALSDNLVKTSRTDAMTAMATGSASFLNDPFERFWNRNYEAINYVNIFLKDDFGISVRYLIDSESNEALCKRLKGEAYALRAFYQWNLLKMFGGKDASGNSLGFIIKTDATDFGSIDNSSVKRNTYEECVKQIISDCDKAAEYLPDMYRDKLVTDPVVDGSIGYHRFDKATVLSIKALVMLSWASPAFNPDNDVTRWEAAAEYADEAMDLKMEVDGELYGFKASDPFLWTDPNAKEIILSGSPVKNASYETAFYPSGSFGQGLAGPTKELADAFPAANGYPISDPRSLFDESDPFGNRDPRLDRTIYHHGSRIVNSSGKVLYVFNCAQNGNDVALEDGNSMTNLYICKFTYPDWDKSASTVLTAAKSVFYIRWTHLLLAYAEAANRAWGPDDDRLGISAKEALSAIRSRSTDTGTPGTGAAGDPYLDECAAAGMEKFEELVRNERRIETCFEGLRLHDLQRWNEMPVSGMDVHRPVYSVGTGRWSEETAETKRMPGPWLPIPYNEARACGNIVQNAGWETWK